MSVPREIVVKESAVLMCICYRELGINERE